MYPLCLKNRLFFFTVLSSGELRSTDRRKTPLGDSYRLDGPMARSIFFAFRS